MIEAVTVLILLLAAVFWAKSKEPPMDHDVILRIRSIADQMRREQLLPYE
jgi:hypothetical protein